MRFWRLSTNHDGMGCGIGGICPACYAAFQRRERLTRPFRAVRVWLWARGVG